MTENTGKLITWKTEKGFGFIQIEDEKKQIFVHISDIITKARPPKVGDIMHYQVATDTRTGKPKAVRVAIEGLPLPSPKSSSRKSEKPKSSRSAIFGSLLLLVFLVPLGFFGVPKLLEIWQRQADSASETIQSLPEAQNFRCEGKTLCSEMTSCEEARFYLRNCPDTEMDGDNDGVSCEQQWCNG